jgi:hypothetical protein
MATWIFKIAKQELYPDEAGVKYVYDNTHSIKVKKGDHFLYLDKSRKYSFTAVGAVKRITERSPTAKEASRTNSVRTVYTAHLGDVQWFDTPLTVSTTTKEGRSNRARLGIVDVNLLGWSHSMPNIGESIFDAILSLCEIRVEEEDTVEVGDFSIEDKWSKAKVRKHLTRFRKTVLERSGFRCVVCGTNVLPLLEAAHLSSYATDVRNRANPANGVCLCKFCHAAMDNRLIAINEDGTLLVSNSISDPIAELHFSNLSSRERVEFLKGVDPRFLQASLVFYNEMNDV